MSPAWAETYSYARPTSKSSSHRLCPRGGGMVSVIPGSRAVQLGCVCKEPFRRRMIMLVRMLLLSLAVSCMGTAVSADEPGGDSSIDMSAIMAKIMSEGMKPPGSEDKD